MMTDETTAEATERPEDEVAGELGVDRQRLRDLRATRLTKGHHWTTRRKAVVYTEVGLARIRELAEEMLAAVPAEPFADALPWAKPPANFWEPFTQAAVTWVRVRRVLANPLVVEGELGDGAVVRLRVRPSRLWEPGLVLPAVEIGEGYFEYRGKMPRFRRRW